ncbi:fumarylacetoacetate hydrolase family protein [Sphingomonas sp. BN140010]|uniref:Fumarylacetoacetate hydrolase family protein n=1 Tax=Sphingomonas arvum TaxID=2992113 RepID=A0ABT3JE55_9SPHN|nr:fumarylacetoacetate hydrolase family protein [Sphingomonas sp. BN140010]MCW3797194.1 fumarylacetoacetate hydrolase family protein [Sphingomonas sp. BN140010]
MTPYRLATLKHDERELAAMVIGEDHFALSEVFPFDPGITVMDILSSWERSAVLLQSIADDIGERGLTGLAPLPRNGIELLTPVRYPNKLIAVGANYPGHLAEMGLEAQKWASMPFFIRPPTTTMVGPGVTVVIPPSTKQFDWECELTIVIGRRLTKVDRHEAARSVAGYTIGLDLSCRDLIPAHNDLQIDLLRGKAQDTMAPCGPYFVPTPHAGDVDALPIRLWVNDALMMDGSTSQMLFKVDEMIATISQYLTLEPGDMIMTGSPPGSAGVHGNAWLKPGDRMRAEIGSLGTFEVTCLEQLAPATVQAAA